MDISFMVVNSSLYRFMLLFRFYFIKMNLRINHKSPQFFSPCIEWPKGLAPKCVFANANKLLGFLWGLLIELSWGAEYYGSQWNNSFATQLRSQCLH